MKTLILAVDIGDKSQDWQVKAMTMQIRDYFAKNRTVLDVENVILFPIKGEMKLFWLEGDPGSPEDMKSLIQIRDRLKPVLEVAMGLKRKNPGVKRLPRKKKHGKGKGPSSSPDPSLPGPR
jgi:hypothetical protein